MESKDNIYEWLRDNCLVAWMVMLRNDNDEGITNEQENNTR